MLMVQLTKQKHKRRSCYSIQKFQQKAHRVLTNFGKIKFLEFSRFFRPSEQFFHTTIKCRHDLTNHLSHQFGRFLSQLLQNDLFTKPGDWLRPQQLHCVTQPDYTTVTDNAHNSMSYYHITSRLPSRMLTSSTCYTATQSPFVIRSFPKVNFKFLQFSAIKMVN